MSIILNVSDLTGKYGTQPVLIARLTDNTPLANRSITFTIHGVSYNRTTDNNGECSLTINLEPGVYDCTVRFNGDISYEPITKVVEVNILPCSTHIVADNLSKKYKKPGQYVVTVHGINNRILTDCIVEFEINGVKYIRTTDSNGQAGLNINLNPGVYQIRVTTLYYYPYKETTIYRTVEVVRQNTRMEGTNIVKYATETAVYQCAVYNENNERILGKVNLEVNGVTYTRDIEADGLARLNIRLWAGEYTIKAWFSGDQFYHGSSIINTIKVRIEGKQALTDAELVKNIESKIYVGGHPNASNGVILDSDVIQQLEKAMPGGISWTEYEINETDRRTKTAKFTTPAQLDLTSNFTYVVITNPYHENFGGVVLSEDYDADKDLYTYQCQDWRRQYMSKIRMVGNEKATIYEILEHLLVFPFTNREKNIPYPLNNEFRNRYKNALTGLRPLSEYNIKIAGLKAQNYLNRKSDTFLSYDSLMDQIFNVALQNNNNLDIWFDMYGVLHLDPIDWDKWINTGLLLTTEDIAEYKYGFDTTNILTGVMVKDANNGTTVWYNNENDLHKTVSDDLAIIYGKHIGAADAPQWQTENNTTTTSTTTTNIFKGKRIAVAHDRGGSSDTAELNQMVNTLKSKGFDAYSVGVGPSQLQNHGHTCSKDTIGIYIANGACCGTWKDFLIGMTNNAYYNYSYVVFVFNRNDIDMSRKQSYAHDWYNGNVGVDTSISRHEFFVKNKDKLSYVNINDGYSWNAVCERTVNNQFGNIIDNNNNTTNTTNNTTTTTQTKVDVNDPNYIAAQYRKAVAEYSKSVRSLMKFSIKVPLTSRFYKYLHTNSFLFTDLPEKFALVNLPKIYKNLASYSVNRGVPYVKNRWYIEAVKIKNDGNGLWADITLNAFPSDQSSFQSAMDGYISAYDSAFKSTSQSTTSSVNNTSKNNIPARTDGKTDCSPAHSVSYVHCATGQNPASVATPSSNDYGKIGREGTNYANFVKGCNSPREVYKKLSNAGWNGANKYRGFDDESVGSSCVEGIFNQGYANCAGMAKLLKACMDVCGFKCAIAHPNGHYMNVVELNGKWESCDLCYQSGTYPGYQSAGFNK